MKKYYSTDDENYCYETFGDVLDALDNDGRLAVGAVYYEGDFQRMTPSQALDAEQVLDAADERGYDLIGESWDNPFSVSDEARDELQGLLNEWAARHLDVSCYYTIVGKSREMKVTADDLPSNHGGKPPRETRSA